MTPLNPGSLCKWRTRHVNWLTAAPSSELAGPADAEPQPARRCLWFWLLSIATTLLFLYLSCRGINWRLVWQTIVHANWRYLAAAGIVTCTSYFLRSLRCTFLWNAGESLSVGLVFSANMAGYLGNNFLPARAGELVRTVWISRQSRLSKAYVLTTAVSERLIDVIALVLGSSVLLLGVEPKPGWMESLSRTMAWASGAAGFALILLPHTGKLAAAGVGKLPARLGARLIGPVEQVLLGVKALHHWERLTGFIAFTVLIWLADTFSFTILARSLNMWMSFTVAFLLSTRIGLGSSLPSTPGYVGVYQFVAITVLTPFAFSRDAALAFILAAQALGYTVILILGASPGLDQLRRTFAAKMIK